MHSAIGIFALAACALASPLLPPIDPNNPLTNPATNKDLLLTNPAWLAPKGDFRATPEQLQTIQNQMITQKNLENFAAQLAAEAGVSPPAGIAPLANAEQIHAQAVAQAQLQAQAQAQAQALVQAHNQAPAPQQFVGEQPAPANRGRAFYQLNNAGSDQFYN
ncbi:hypothetical protein GGI07_003168 [Coemansia sp. Benny D115]|nr:hypothetical protein GGI07_003168 [Coemansia sp. Benny D115]